MKNKFSFIANIIKNRGYFSKIPAVVKMFKAHFRGEFRVSYKHLAIAALVIGYVISPLDFIPFFFIDDLGLVMLALGYLMKEVSRYEEWESAVKRGYSNAKIIDAEIVK